VLHAHNVALGEHEVRAYFRAPGLTASATRVVHGGVPGLGWRVSMGDKNIVFFRRWQWRQRQSGTSRKERGFIRRTQCNPEGETDSARQLHMPPSVIARIGQTAGVKRIVLSHLMLRTLGRESETQAVISRTYSGPVVFANDLDCFH